MVWVTDSPVDTTADPRTAALNAQENTPVDIGQGFGQQSLFSGATVSGSALRYMQRENGNDTAVDMGQQKLSPEYIDKNYGPIGPDGKQVPISGGQSMYPETAQLIAKAKGDELDRQGIISRFQNQHGVATNFAVGVAAFLSDPLNGASLFVPGLGEENAAVAVGRIGLTGTAAKVGGRLIEGATGATAGQVPLIAAQYGLGTQEASDYSMRDAFRDLTFNAALGALFHAGFGSVGDAWKSRNGIPPESGGVPPAAGGIEGVPPPPDGGAGGATETEWAKANAAKDIVDANARTKHGAMTSSVSQILDGREVSVDPFYPKAGEEQSLADLAQKQQEVYREGFQPSMTSGELKEVTDDVFGEKTAKQENAPFVPQATEQKVYEEPAKVAEPSPAVPEKTGPTDEDVSKKNKEKLALMEEARVLNAKKKLSEEEQQRANNLPNMIQNAAKEHRDMRKAAGKPPLGNPDNLNKGRLTAIGYLKRLGGIKKSAETERYNGGKLDGYIFKKTKGMSPDAARDALERAGYIKAANKDELHKSDIDDLHKILEDHVDGTDTYNDASKSMKETEHDADKDEYDKHQAIENTKLEAHDVHDKVLNDEEALHVHDLRESGYTLDEALKTLEDNKQRETLRDGAYTIPEQTAESTGAGNTAGTGAERTGGAEGGAKQGGEQLAEGHTGERGEPSVAAGAREPEGKSTARDKQLSEQDQAIAELTSKIDTSKMTDDELADLYAGDKEIQLAELYKKGFQSLADCLKGV